MFIIFFWQGRGIEAICDNCKHSPVKHLVTRIYPDIFHNIFFNDIPIIFRAAPGLLLLQATGSFVLHVVFHCPTRVRIALHPRHRAHSLEDCECRLINLGTLTPLYHSGISARSTPHTHSTHCSLVERTYYTTLPSPTSRIFILHPLSSQFPCGLVGATTAAVCVGFKHEAP